MLEKIYSLISSYILNTSIFYTTMPEEPTNLIAILDFAGTNINTFDSCDEYKEVEIIVRNEDYSVASSQSASIKSILLNTNIFTHVVESQPAIAKQDINDYFVLTARYKILA